MDPIQLIMVHDVCRAAAVYFYFFEDDGNTSEKTKPSDALAPKRKWIPVRPFVIRNASIAIGAAIACFLTFHHGMEDWDELNEIHNENMWIKLSFVFFLADFAWFWSNWGVRHMKHLLTLSEWKDVNFDPTLFWVFHGAMWGTLGIYLWINVMHPIIFCQPASICVAIYKFIKHKNKKRDEIKQQHLKLEKERKSI